MAVFETGSLSTMFGTPDARLGSDAFQTPRLDMSRLRPSEAVHGFVCLPACAWRGHDSVSGKEFAFTIHGPCAIGTTDVAALKRNGSCAVFDRLGDAIAAAEEKNTATWLDYTRARSHGALGRVEFWERVDLHETGERAPSAQQLRHLYSSPKPS